MSHVSGGSSSRGLSDRKENSSSGRPLLVLPDVIHEFSLFMNEKEGVSLPVLSQNIGLQPWPAVCLSEQSNGVAARRTAVPVGPGHH